MVYMFLYGITSVRHSIYLLYIGTLLLGVFSCSEKEKTSLVLLHPICLASQSQCTITTQFGELSVLFDQKIITPENEFSIWVGNENIDESFIITGFLEGKTMYMGKIPLFFAKGKQRGFRIANAMLGSCSDKNMVWTLQLTVTQESNANTNANRLNAQSKEEHFSIEFTSIRE